MKPFLILAFFLSVAPIGAQSITINEAEANVAFVFLDENVEGTMDGFQFTGNVDLGALDSSVIAGTVETKTLDTNNWLRSRHLRSKKFFHAKEFPTLSFESGKISGTKESFIVEGTLKIKGINKNVQWNFSNDGSQLIGTTAINTHDFNVIIYKERERCDVEITVRLPYVVK